MAVFPMNPARMRATRMYTVVWSVTTSQQTPPATLPVCAAITVTETKRALLLVVVEVEVEAGRVTIRTAVSTGRCTSTQAATRLRRAIHRIVCTWSRIRRST